MRLARITGCWTSTDFFFFFAFPVSVIYLRQGRQENIYIYIISARGVSGGDARVIARDGRDQLRGHFASRCAP